LDVPDKFDAYREALVLETNTVWPEEYQDLSAAEKRTVEASLQADPASCSNLEYVRVYTGFCRQITVTAADLARIRQSAK